nr:RNA-directed DNA polymerase, eukaryota, nucleotide-binding alpha-beta plait domain protein [Tanacetum cinerariifolium]
MNQKGLLKTESEPIKAYFKNNRVVHKDYLQVTKEHVATLEELLEETRALKHLDELIGHASKFAKRIQELSKAGKRFAFVRFIKVDNVDRLVGNLCTLWIGRMHLHANVVHFERTPSQVPRPSQPVRKATHTGNTFAFVVKGNLVSLMSSSHALVLDDTCLEDRDYENCVMRGILQFSSISNLRILLFHEVFLSVRTVYLGGL